MNKLATLTLLCLLPCAAQAALSDALSAEDYARLTHDTPYRLDCPFIGPVGFHDCGEAPEPVTVPSGGQVYQSSETIITREDVADYLPDIVREQGEQHMKKRRRS